MIHIFNRLVYGVLSPVKGLKILFSSKKIFLLSLIPFFIGLGMIVLSFALASQYLIPFVENWTQNIEWLQFSETLAALVGTAILIFSWIAIGVANFILGYLIIILVAGPFYALMAEEIFRRNHRQIQSGNSIVLILKMFLVAIVKVSFFLMVGLLCFIASFIPILNLISTFVVFLLVAFDLTDYSFEIDSKNLRQSLKFIMRHLPEYSGLALMVALTTLLPGSFFILLPAFICGATQMYIQLSNKAV